MTVTAYRTLLPIYLRREPAKQDQWKGDFDVVAYRSLQSTRPWAVWDYHNKQKPTRRNRVVTLNCSRWRVIWLPDREP